MKKKITVILLTIALLAGCEAAPATAQENIPDIDAIVQQSVAEAIAQYEEAQREKDTEIAMLKAQLEELTSLMVQVPDAADSPATASTEETATPASSQPEESETQPEPVSELEEPAPAQSSAPSSRYDGFDLRNMYPAFIWENFQPIEEDPNANGVWVYEDEDDEDEWSENSSGFLREDDAWMVTQLINQEREAHGLEVLPVSDDLMELAAVRAEERSYPPGRNKGFRTAVRRKYRSEGFRRNASRQLDEFRGPSEKQSVGTVPAYRCGMLPGGKRQFLLGGGFLSGLTTP